MGTAEQKLEPRVLLKPLLTLILKPSPLGVRVRHFAIAEHQHIFASILFAKFPVDLCNEYLVTQISGGGSNHHLPLATTLRYQLSDLPPLSALAQVNSHPPRCPVAKLPTLHSTHAPPLAA
ncbi:hypothetical protein ACLKA6_013025 [Drosophila palustris]